MFARKKFAGQYGEYFFLIFFLLIYERHCRNFLDEISDKINILPLKIDKKVSKKKSQQTSPPPHFFEKSAQFLSDCYEEMAFFCNFHRQNKNIKTRFRFSILRKMANLKS